MRQKNAHTRIQALYSGNFLRTALTGFLVLSCLFMASGAQAQQQATQDGLDYLTGAQQGDGSWLGGPPVNRSSEAVTAMVLEAYGDLDLTGTTEFSSGANYLQGASVNTPAALGWQIIGLARAGRGTASQLSALTALQRSDGTWSASGPGQPLSVYDTAVALRAYRAAGQSATNELSALRTVLRQQRNDGGFDAGSTSSSDVETTGVVLEALAAVSDSYIVDFFQNQALAYLSDAQNADGGWGNPSSNTFDTANALYNLLANDEIPDNPDAGINYLLGQQQGDGSWSGRPEDTAYALRVLRDVRPDLTIVEDSLVFSNDEPDAGEIVSITASVQNIGLVSPGPFTVRFYNGDPDFGGAPIGDAIEVSNLTSAEPQTVHVDWDTTGIGGSRQIFVRVDPANEVDELREDNNTVSSLIFVISDTDLVITPSDISFTPPNPVVGDRVTMNVTIRNEGREANDVLVYVLLEGSQIAEANFPLIPQAEQVVFTLPLTGFQAGRHEFTVQVDPENTITEGNEENNEAVNAMVLSVKRDLYLTPDDISFVPGRPLAGDMVTVNAVIHNQGDESAQNIIVQFFNGDPQAGGSQIGGSQTIDLVPADGNASTQVQFDTTGLSGTYDIYVFADATERISEQDETNNLVSKQFSVAQNIDLTVPASLITFDNERPEDGDVVRVTAAVKNEGLVAADGVTAQFFDGPPSTLVPSWPVQTRGSVLASPVFTDLDGDRRLEIIAGSLDAKLYVLRSDGSNYPGWPVTLSGGIRSTAAVGDVDGDTEAEIVVASRDGAIYAMNADGSLVTGFPFTTTDEIVSSPNLTDLNNDGIPEIIIGCRNNGLYVVSGDGSVMTGFPVAAQSWIDTTPVAEDIDGDGQPEIIAGSHDNNIYAWNTDGSTVDGFPYSTGGFVTSSPAVGDIDLDGLPEVVIGSDDGNVYALNGDGSIVDNWPKTTGSFVRAAPALVDLDGNGTLDVIAASFDQKVYAWNGDGTLLAGTFPRFVGADIESSPVVADIDADGEAEIVVAGRDGQVYAVNHDGSMAGAPFPFSGTSDFRSTPMLADIDADGAMEIVIGCDDGRIYSFDLPADTYNPLNIQWPMFQRDARHSAKAGPFTERASSSGRPIGDPIDLGTMAGGASQNISVDWDTTGGFGEHAIYVQVDPEDTVVETDESNNLSFKEIFVLIPDIADFLVQSKDISFSPSQIEPGDTLQVSARIRNIGTLDTTDVLIRFYDGNPASDTSEILNEVRRDLNAGSSVDIAFDWVTDATDEGGHSIFVQVDPDNEVDEFNEFDNITSKFFYVGNRPPFLNWVNATSTRIGSDFSDDPYAYTGVEPELGYVETEFVYQIEYTDPDNNPPGEGYPRVYIDINGDGDTVDETPDFREGSFAMTEANPDDQDYSNGKVYEYRTSLPLGNLARYRFEAQDNGGQVASGEPRVMYQNLGPAVVKSSIRVNTMPDYRTWIGRQDPERETNEIVLYGNVHYYGDVSSGYYRWDFGDGTAPVVGLVEDPDYIATTHVYSNIGTYRASLTVVDEAGNSDTDYVEVKVEPDSTAARRRAVVLDALRFLYKRQDKTWGTWERGRHYPASTGLGLLAFTDHDFLQIDDYDDSIFAEYLAKGFRFLYTRAKSMDASSFDSNSRGHEGDFPIFDRNANGLGYYWNQTSTYYESGMALMGFVGDRESRLYIEFVQDVVDFFMAAQGPEGAWRYSFRRDVDNSAAQWPTLALFGAMQCPFFADIPDWVWAANHPDDPYGTGLLGWLNACQTTSIGDNQGSFGYTYGTKYTVTPAGLIMYHAAGVPLDGAQSRYTFDTSNLTAGQYYIYAIINDGVNPPYSTYLDSPITVENHRPTITVKDPDDRSGGTPADEVFYISWIGNDYEGDFTVSLYYDTDDDSENGFSGTIVEDYDAPAGEQFYRWDTSAIPQDTYRIYAEITDSEGQTSSDYSDGGVVIQHDTPPVVQVLSPIEETYPTADQVEIQWIAHDLHSPTGTVSIWYDTNRRGFNGTAIEQDIDIVKDTLQTYTWDTSEIPEDEYWVYVTVDDGVNTPFSDYTPGVIHVNKPPVIDFTTPEELGEEPNSSGNYRIRWDGGDAGGATLELFYDTDKQGLNGTPIQPVDIRNNRYDWNTNRIPEGEYFIYGVARDGYNDAVIEYASGSISVPAYRPQITVLDPSSNVTFDTSYHVRWDDAAPNTNSAMIDIFLDPDSNSFDNGNEIFLAQNIAQTDSANEATFDISSITEGQYYVVASINETVTPELAVYDRSSARLTISHDNSPRLLFLEPAADITRLATESSFNVDISFIASDANDDATLALYYDTNRSGYDGTVIPGAENLSENQDSISTFVWDTSVLTPDDYYLYAIVQSPTESYQIYSDTHVKVNQPPMIHMTAPIGTEASAEAEFRITWEDDDPGDRADISLYYDTNDSGADGELIVEGLSENSNTDRYDWDLSRVPAGVYYVYAVIEDGVNNPVIDYSTGPLEIQQHIPRAIVHEPEEHVTADHLYTIRWEDWDLDSNASIDIYLDVNNSWSGNEILMATGTLFEDDNTDYYTLDLSDLREDDYYAVLSMSDDNRTTLHNYYSSRRIYVEHANDPAVLVDDSTFPNGTVENTVNVRYFAESNNPSAEVTLYIHSSENFNDNRVLLSGLSTTGPAGASEIVSITPYSSSDWYISAQIDDGVNPLLYNTSNTAIRINTAPEFSFTSPVSLNTPPDDPTGNRDLFTISWTSSDPDDQARIALYYDSDNSGFDGTQIVRSLREGSDTSYEWDTSRVPSGQYYIYAVVTDPYHDPLRVYSPGTFRIDPDHKPQLTVLNPYSGEDTWDQHFVIQWSDLDFDSDAAVSFYIEDETPGYDGIETPIVEGISEDDEANYHIWDISSVTNGSYEILGVIRDATWTVEDAAPRPLKIQHSAEADLNPTMVFVKPGTELLPESILVEGQRARGEVVNVTTTAAISFFAYDKETPDQTTIDLYIDTDNDDFDGTLIAENVPISSNGGINNYEWDVSQVNGGTYYIYGVIFDGQNDPLAYYSHTVYSINREPDIDIIPPEPPFDVVDDSFIIEWEGTDPDSAASIALYWDTDNTGFDGELIVEGINENAGGGPKLTLNWLEDRYDANLEPNHPLLRLSQPAYRDGYYLYGIAKALRLYEVLSMDGKDWDAELVDFMVEDSVSRQKDGSLDLDYGSGSHFRGSGADENTMNTAVGVLSLTPAVLGTLPVADAGVDQRVAPGDQVAFDGSESFHPNKRREIILYEWDFDGDGLFDYSSDEPTAEHTYDQLGLYSVTLRVHDNDFCEPLTDDDIMLVTVTDGNRPPVAEFTVDPLPGLVGFEVTFDGTSSSDPDGDNIARYEWDLNGNGLFNDAEGPVVTRVYTREQIVNIGLRVTDDNPEEPLTGFVRQDVEIVEADLTIIAQGDSPDPFSPGSSTGRKDTNIISFDLSKKARPFVQLFDGSGAPVRALGPQLRNAGGNTYSWDGRDDGAAILPSDLFTYKIADQGATLYPELGWQREDGIRVNSAADPEVRRQQDFSLQMLYTADSGGGEEIHAGSSNDGLAWSDDGVLIPRGLNGSFDSAASREPDFVKLTPTVQESWSAGIDIDYASGVRVEPVAGGIQLAGLSEDLTGLASIKSASSSSPESFPSASSRPLTDLLDGSLPSKTNPRDRGWLHYNDKTASFIFQFEEAQLLQGISVYTKTDNNNSTKVYYPDRMVVLVTTDENIPPATQVDMDLRSLPEEDTARWIDAQFPAGGVAAVTVEVKLTTQSGSWMALGEVAFTQSGYDSEGFVLSNVFDTGHEGLLSVQWKATRPANTAIDFEYRTGDTEEPDATWSAFNSAGTDTIIPTALHGRYVQYRATLRTGLSGNTNVTPILNEVRFNDLSRIYYTGSDGTTDRILSALSLDGVSFTAEDGARLTPGGTFDDEGVADPLFLPAVPVVSLTDLADLVDESDSIFFSDLGMSLPASETVGPNIAAASEGTMVLYDLDRFDDNYIAEKGIEGDGGADRASRWAGADGEDPWTIDFDLGQERTIQAVRMIPHDSRYESTGFKIYTGSVYSTSDETDFSDFDLAYDSPVYETGTTHVGPFPPATGRYIRLVITESNNSHPEFSEFELYEDVRYATEGYIITQAVRIGEEGINFISLDADTPSGTSIKVEVSSGPGLIVDDRWSSFVEIDQDEALHVPSLSGEFARFRITLSGTVSSSPVLRAINVNGQDVLFYTGTTGGVSRILSAVSDDGLTWQRGNTPAIDVGGLAGFSNVVSPDVTHLPGGGFVMYFLGQRGGQWGAYRATSPNATLWEIEDDPILTQLPGEDSLGSTQFLPQLDGTSRLYFTSITGATSSILSAVSAPEGRIEVDNIPPDVALAEPAPNAILVGSVNVIGTAVDRNYKDTNANFDGFTISLSSDGGQSFQQLASAIQPVTGSLLHVLNTRAFADGDYLLKLSADDTAGNQSETTVPVTFKNGALPRPIITSPTVHGVPVTVAFSPITVQGSAANNTDVEGFMTNTAGQKQSIGIVETTGGSSIPQTYTDDDYSDGEGNAFDESSSGVVVATDGSITLPPDESSENVLDASAEATASSQYGGSYNPSRALDDNSGTYWRSGRDEPTAWINFHFEQARQIGGIRINWRTSNNSEDFRIQALVGNTYNDLIVSPQTSGSHLFAFTDLTTTDIRIYTDTITARYIEISEVSLLGPAFNRSNLASSDEGGQLVSYTSQYNSSSWAAEHVLQGLGEYWSSTDLRGATDNPQEFIIQLNTGGQATTSISKLVVYNYGQDNDQYCSKNFEFAVSTTDTDPASFSRLFPGTLEQRTGAQAFDFPTTDAKYVKFTVLSGYHPDFWELDEIQVFPAGSQGTLVSNLMGSGAIDDFNVLEYIAETPDNTSVQFEYRTGNVTPADDSYSDWMPIGNGQLVDDDYNARYFQYRATLSSTDTSVSPILYQADLSTVGEYGNWAIPNVVILGGTNTITAVAIDPVENNRSEEALPIDVLLDVVDVVVTRDKDTYSPKEDVEIDLSVTSPPSDAPGAQSRTFTAQLQILDEVNRVINADTAGMTNYEILERPFWIDDAVPQDATYSANLVWVNDPALRSSSAHTADGVTGEVAHFIDSPTTPLPVTDGSRLVQYVYLDTDNSPREIMLEITTHDGSSDHRIFWGEDLIDRGVMGTPGRLSGGSLPEPGQWARLEVDPASVNIDGATITGINFLTYDGQAYWDRTALGIKEFEFSLNVDETKDYAFTWDTGMNDEGDYHVLATLSLPELERAAQGESELFEILAVDGISAEIATNKSEYNNGETVKLDFSVLSEAINFTYTDLTLAVSVPNIGGATLPLFETEAGLDVLDPMDDAAFQDQFILSGAAAGDYDVSLEVLSGSPATVLTSAETSFEVLVDEPGLAGRIQADRPLFILGDQLILNYQLINTANGTVSGLFHIRIVYQADGSEVAMLDIGSLTLPTGDVQSATTTLDTGSFQQLGEYTAYLEFENGTYVLDFDVTEAYQEPTTATPTPTATPTDTATSTPTDTATYTPTATFTDTATATPTDTPTVTPTPTDTPALEDKFVLTGFGEVYQIGSASPTVDLQLPAGMARAFEVTPSRKGFVILDILGNVYLEGDAAGLNIDAPVFGFDIARDIALNATGDGAYVLTGFGPVHPVNVPPDEFFGGFYFGSFIHPFDVARDMEAIANPAGSVTGYYVLDALGGVHALGGAPWMGNLDFGYELARDVEVMPTQSGYAVLDGYGGVQFFPSELQDSPMVQSWLSGAPYFGWDIARDLEFSPGRGMAANGYWVLDGYGNIWSAGSASDLDNLAIDEADVYRDME